MLKKRPSVFQILFFIYAMYGFLQLQEYGVGADELTQRNIGIENNRYLTQGLHNPELAKHPFFAPIFESIAYGLEQVVFPDNLKMGILLRHTLLWILWCLALWLFFGTLKLIAKNTPPLAVFLPTAMLACYPRFFAEAHYNSKDLLLIVIFIIAFKFFIDYLQNTKTIFSLTMAAIFFGIAAEIRFYTAIYAIIASFWIPYSRENKEKWQHFFYFGIVSTFAFYLFFPALWQNPFAQTQRLFQYYTQNPWPWPVLFEGKLHSASHLPWYYLPKWIWLCTPVVVFIVWLCIPIFLRQTAIHNKFYQLLVCFFAIPFLLILILNPVKYDTWRHYYILIIPLFYLSSIPFAHVKNKIVLYGSAIFVLISIAIQLLFTKNKEFVYFNEFQKLNNSTPLYPLDYWAISGKKILETLGKNEPLKPKNIYCFGDVIELNKKLLSPSMKDNIIQCKTADSADFIIELFRDKNFAAIDSLHFQEIYSSSIYNWKFARVLQRKK